MIAGRAGHEPPKSGPKIEADGVIEVASNCTAGSSDSHLNTLPVYELGGYLNVSAFCSEDSKIQSYSLV